MSDQKLRDTLRPAVEAMFPARQQRKLAVMSSAFGVDGGINPDALASALPGWIIPWYLPGTVTIGTNVGAEIELPSTVRITGIRLRQKGAPTANETTVRLTGDGAEIATASISIGQPSGRSAGLSAIVNAGVVLRVDVVTASGSDLTAVVSYAPVAK